MHNGMDISHYRRSEKEWHAYMLLFYLLLFMNAQRNAEKLAWGKLVKKHKKLFFLYLLFIGNQGSGESRYIYLCVYPLFLLLLLLWLVLSVCLSLVFCCLAWDVTEREEDGWFVVISCSCIPPRTNGRSVDFVDRFTPHPPFTLWETRASSIQDGWMDGWVSVLVCSCLFSYLFALPRTNGRQAIFHSRAFLVWSG